MASITSATASASSSTSSNGQNYRGPFAIMTALLFLWGFMTVFNDNLRLAMTLVAGGAMFHFSANAAVAVEAYAFALNKLI